MKPVEIIQNQNEQSRTNVHHDSFQRGFIAALLVDIELDDTTEVNSWGGATYFYVTNRDDLMKLMTLAPRWEKTTATSRILYRAIIPYGGPVHIYVSEGALPDTCKLVEEEVVIPATPERVEKRMVVKCNQPPETPAATEETPVT